MRDMLFRSTTLLKALNERVSFKHLVMFKEEHMAAGKGAT